MKRAILLAICVFFFSIPPVFASSHSLILNFAQMNEKNWAAEETEWQTTVKPSVTLEIKAMRETLDPRFREDDKGVVLGWSTLMEYMNFPMDKPGPNSPYVVKTRRILEVADDLDLPVFFPLNGFQWWNELPELYNWWDPDGTQTDPKFFSRQDNPADFKRRFIAGFNSDNQENVLWQSKKTPMKLNYRNWGGGGFRLAPPPNLESPAYLAVQHARLTAIVQEIAKKRLAWEKENKGYLFAGLSIGTEISLNASATPADEFKSYGGDDRVAVVQKYMEDNARLIVRLGIPKEYIYTHVLGEQDQNDPHYGGIAAAAFNLYSNPGVSLYGYAKDPGGSAQWNKVLSGAGNPPWGIMEYNAGDSASDWTRGLSEAARLSQATVIYNWDGLSPNAIPAIKRVLSSESPMPNVQCHMPIEHVQRGIVAKLENADIATTSANLPHGIYVKFTATKCADGKTMYSQPEKFYVPLPMISDTTPGWVEWVLDKLEQ